jgi:hypothetical protein
LYNYLPDFLAKTYSFSIRRSTFCELISLILIIQTSEYLSPGVELIADFVEAVPLQANPTELRCRLLAAHQLTDIQQVDGTASPAAADSKSEAVAARQDAATLPQNNAFFNCLFLNKLPRVLRIPSPYFLMFLGPRN